MSRPPAEDLAYRIMFVEIGKTGLREESPICLVIRGEYHLKAMRAWRLSWKGEREAELASKVDASGTLRDTLCRIPPTESCLIEIQGDRPYQKITHVLRGCVRWKRGWHIRTWQPGVLGVG